MNEKNTSAAEPHVHVLLERTVHDLKNPLAVVSASLEWLETELSEGAELSASPDARDAVRDASTAVARMIVIIEELETLAYIESGRPLARQDVELGMIVSRAEVRSAARLGARGITVASSAVPAADIVGDPLLLTRAIEALVVACARGAPKGACVEIEARVGEGVIEIEIGLRGAVATAPPVASIEALAHGSLGVYLALRIVEVHGGALLVAATATMPRGILRLPARAARPVTA